MIFVFYTNIQIVLVIDTGQTADTDCNTDYKMILLMMVLTTFWWWKLLKTDQSREVRTYVTWVNPFYAKCKP